MYTYEIIWLTNVILIRLSLIFEMRDMHYWYQILKSTTYFKSKSIYIFRLRTAHIRSSLWQYLVPSRLLGDCYASFFLRPTNALYQKLLRILKTLARNNQKKCTKKIQIKITKTHQKMCIKKIQIKITKTHSCKIVNKCTICFRVIFIHLFKCWYG